MNNYFILSLVAGILMIDFVLVDFDHLLSASARKSIDNIDVNK